MGVLHVPAYGYRQALYLALYSAHIYVDVARRWRGLACCYLLLLIALSSLPFCMRLTLDIKHYVEDIVLSPIGQLPKLTITHGHANTSYVTSVLHDNQDTIRGVVTTHGTFAMWQAIFPELELLVTADSLTFQWPPLHLFFLDKPIETKTNPHIKYFDSVGDDEFVGSVWAQSVNRFLWIILALIYPTIVCCFFGFFLSLLLVFSFIGQLVARTIFKMQLSFIVSWRLMTVAATLPIMLFWLMLALNAPWRLGLVYLTMLAIYFSYAMLSVRNHSKQLVFA